MKKGKRIISVALATIMSVSMFATVASADKWVTTTAGTKYQYTDGTYAKSKWVNTKAGKYYINSKGVRSTGVVNIKSADGTKDTYYFNSKGIMQTGWQLINGKAYYFQKSGKAVKNKKLKISGYCYKFDANGVWTGKVYDSTGKKDVTKSVNVEKLTGIKAATAATTATKPEKPANVPETVTIKGKVYKTQVTNTFVNHKPDCVYPDGIPHTRFAIDITDCTDKDLECLKYFTNLEYLELWSYKLTDSGKEAGINKQATSKITNLDFAKYMPNLKSIWIQNADYLTDLSGLAECKNLERIYINNCDSLTNIDVCNNFKNLKYIDVSCTGLTNLDGIANCDKLEECWFLYDKITDISGLANKKNLKILSINGLKYVKDKHVLDTYTDLEFMELDDDFWHIDS